MFLILWFSNKDFAWGLDEYNFPLKLRFCSHLIVSFLEINNLFNVYKLSLSCYAGMCKHVLVLKELSTSGEGDGILGTLGARNPCIKQKYCCLFCSVSMHSYTWGYLLLCCLSSLSRMCNLSENGLVRFESPFSHHSIEKKILWKRKAFILVLSLLFTHLNLQMALFSKVYAVSLTNFPDLSELFFFLKFLVFMARNVPSTCC